MTDSGLDEMTPLHYRENLWQRQVKLVPVTSFEFNQVMASLAQPNCDPSYIISSPDLALLIKFCTRPSSAASTVGFLPTPHSAQYALPAEDRFEKAYIQDISSPEL
jgi:hypothetical protein